MTSSDIEPFKNSYIANKCLYMGTKEIQSDFSRIRSVARRVNPSSVPLVNKIERICLSRKQGRLSAERTRFALRQVLIEHGKNPSMLDMAEAQARASKTFGPIPDTRSQGVLQQINNVKPSMAKSGFSKEKDSVLGLMQGIQVNRMRQTKPLAISIMGKSGKGMSYQGISIAKQINESKGIFKDFKMPSNNVRKGGVFKSIDFGSQKPLINQFKNKVSKQKNVFNFKQGKQKSVLSLIKEVKQ
jgi:hypothetical protein